MAVTAYLATALEHAARPDADFTREDETQRQEAITAAFYDDVGDSSIIDIPRISLILESLRGALFRERYKQAGVLVNAELARSTIEQQGGEIPASMQWDLRSVIASIFAQDEDLRSWESHRVVNVRLLRGRTEIVAYVRHRLRDGRVVKMRWWLTKRLGRWQVYDYEDLMLGYRFSQVAFSSESSTLDEALRRYNLGVQRFNEGEWDAAIRELEAVLLANSDVPIAHLLLGKALLQADRPNEALTHAGQYIEILGRDVEVYVLFSDACFALNRSKESENYARLALKEDPVNTEAALSLVLALPEERKHEITQAYDPERGGESFLHVAARFVENGMSRALTALIESYPEWAQSDADTENRRAEILKDLEEMVDGSDEYAQTVDFYEMLQKLDPEGFDETQAEKLAAAYAAQGELLEGADAAERFEKAVEIRERLAREQPAVTERQLELARALHTLGIALDWVRPTDSLGAFERSRKILERLAREHPANDADQYGLDETYLSLGIVHNHEQNSEEAAAFLEKAIAIKETLADQNPRDQHNRDRLLIAYDELRRALTRAEMPAEALIVSKKELAVQQAVAAEDPADVLRQETLAKSWATVAWLEYETGRFTDATGSRQKTLEIWTRLSVQDPGDVEYRDKLAAASSLLSWLLATVPDAGERDGSRAVQLATRANELTDWKDSEHVDALAAAYAEAGDFVAAVRWQKKALELLVESKYRDAFQSRLQLYEAKKPYRLTRRAPEEE